jgi:hypothetical protein
MIHRELPMTTVSFVQRRGALLALLHPRGQGRWFAAATIVGALLAWLATTRLRLPLWVATTLVIGLLLVPAVRKWRRDRQQLGTRGLVLSVLLATQGFHTIEHVAQWVQYHLLNWPLNVASGLISPLNAEIVHFTWNVAVLLAITWLLAGGLRHPAMWLLALWAGAHTAEHTYLFAQYLAALEASGGGWGAAQGLPGFFGQGGWLAQHAGSSRPIAFFCTLLPGLTSAPRLDVHFWWNLGEIALLIPAVHISMRQRISGR